MKAILDPMLAPVSSKVMFDRNWKQIERQSLAKVSLTSTDTIFKMAGKYKEIRLSCKHLGLWTLADDLEII